MPSEHMKDCIKFLGTAGARFVVSKQLRSSGGMWLSLNNTQMLIDPGPGTLVRCVHSRPRLDPVQLDGIVLTHRHLDHCGDVNAMIEAMTQGGFKRKGIIFAPSDALEEDPVVLRYARDYVDGVVTLKEGGQYTIGNISFSTPIKHQHGGVETYGLNIYRDTKSNRGAKPLISLIVDTRYFPALVDYYTGSILILNVVQATPMEGVDHLDVMGAQRIIAAVRPKLAILTHFGMTMLRAKPWEVAGRIKRDTGHDVVAASDGMAVDLEPYE